MVELVRNGVVFDKVGKGKGGGAENAGVGVGEEEVEEKMF